MNSQRWWEGLASRQRDGTAKHPTQSSPWLAWVVTWVCCEMIFFPIAGYISSAFSTADFWLVYWALLIAAFATVRLGRRLSIRRQPPIGRRMRQFLLGAALVLYHLLLLRYVPGASLSAPGLLELVGGGLYWSVLVSVMAFPASAVALVLEVRGRRPLRTYSRRSRTGPFGT